MTALETTGCFHWRARDVVTVLVLLLATLLCNFDARAAEDHHRRLDVELLLHQLLLHQRGREAPVEEVGREHRVRHREVGVVPDQVHQLAGAHAKARRAQAGFRQAQRKPDHKDQQRRPENKASYQSGAGRDRRDGCCRRAQGRRRRLRRMSQTERQIAGNQRRSLRKMREQLLRMPGAWDGVDQFNLTFFQKVKVCCRVPQFEYGLTR